MGPTGKQSAAEPTASAKAPQSDLLAEPTARHGTQAMLTLGALGIVFGDIGTSPLYSLQTVFSIEHNSVKPTPVDVFGVISMVILSLIHI